MPRLRAFTRAKVGGLSGPFWLLWSGTLINRIGYLFAPLGGTRLLALGPAVPWLACGLLTVASAAGLLALAPAIRRRSRAARAAGGCPAERDQRL
jgi:hypothetical protein